MKTTLVLFAALCPVVASSYGQLTINDPSYQAVPYFTHTNADTIVSYDWGSNGNVYYQTSNTNFNFGGFYQYASGTSTAIVPGGSTSVFPGASVVSIGANVYFNTSDFTNENIYKYTPGSTPPTAPVSTATNYGLYKNQGNLFITGAPGFTNNHIYYSAPDRNGNLLTSTPADLGTQAGASGPLAFDAAGNLFYASGTGQNIYRWTSAQVAAAVADPINHPLPANAQWLNYSALYDAYTGAVSILLDQKGNLLVNLADYDTSSSLVAEFGVGADGAYDQINSTLANGVGTNGELRLYQNTLYLSNGNEVFALVPEPSTVCLLVAGGLLAVALLRRRASA